MDQMRYRKLISCPADKRTAYIVRLLLRPAGLVYLAVIKLRNLLYSRGWLKAHRANAVVISVGNITVGGTGKTPLVIWLCNFLAKKNIRCAILTRGYKTNQKFTDEPATITNNCPGTQVLVNPDRIASAAEAIENLGAQVLILDDGFQHRRLGRDIDIVTIDATEPFGYGRLLPAGLLREPPSGLRRADAVVITRCDQAPQDKLRYLEDRLRSINPGIIIARSIHAPTYVGFADGSYINPAELTNKKVFTFCGLGNPDAFFNTVRKAGGNIIGSMAFDDHYHYNESCVGKICERARNYGAEMVLTTEKDWTKIVKLRTVNNDISFAYLAVEIRFVAGEDRLIALIEKVLAGKIRPEMGPGR